MSYNAKLLLFGEHIVLQGAQALAIPWPKYQGSWQWAAPEDKERLQQQLPQLLAYLNQLDDRKELKNPFHLSAFAEDLERGLYFNSDIPIGYGAGSSGALCAAIYDRYCAQTTSRSDYQQLKQELGQIESFFHGSSSGTDPLICYLNQAILIGDGGNIESLATGFERLPPPYQLFVIDTGIRRKTGPFVEEVLKRSKENSAFKKTLADYLIPASNNCIFHLLNANQAALASSFQQVSILQKEYLSFLIPSEFQDLWNLCLASQKASLKICGAGGGGFILGLSNDPDFLLGLQKDYKIKLL